MPLTRIRVPALFALALMAAALPAAARQPANPTGEFTYESVVPLGAEVLQLQPINRKLQLIASAESNSFDGLKRVDDGGRHWMLRSNGRLLRRFPRFVLFRVTADARRGPGLDDDHPFLQAVHTDLNSYLLDLRFRVVVFHGLEQRILEPRTVQLLGVPRDYPSDERIYAVGVELPDLPASDRVVLEVRDPAGNRLTKFHLDF